MKSLNILVASLIALSSFVAVDSFALSGRACLNKIPKTIKYRKRYAACGNKAALILSGPYYNAFSVVFKRVDHNDRLANNCPDASCSPFKAQKTIKKNGIRTVCFGAAGDSPVFKGYDPDLGFSSNYIVKFISIKRANSGNINDVDLYCMNKPYPATEIN